NRRRKRPAAMIRLKRVYENSSKEDGVRILVERLWPRGLTKEKAGIDLWLKEIAPSDGLRKWFNHDPAKWNDFRKRYEAELKKKKEPLDQLRQKIEEGNVTFVYAARDEAHNSAVILKRFLGL
ncbi:MAG TPA: DUF488 domain-containing protein, partial [Nitrospiria bacterium]|nr:DUF488 domain-containing protein [Nitrospiria bacterium]